MNRISDPRIMSKLALRAYLATMRFEGTWALGLRRWLVGVMTGQRLNAVNIFPDVFLEGVGGLRLGHHVSLNRASNISAFGGITIGNHVSIGHGVSIVSTNHGFSDRDRPIQLQSSSYEPVAIGDNVWIGARATILGGVSVASGTVIAAGAVVTKSIAEPDMIVAGVPARAIKSRFE